MILKLAREWELGDRIGGGGFGQVYEATASDGTVAVAKLVPKAPGAHRELLFVSLVGVRNVVPIIDSGETATHWVLIMPRAERSLREHLKKLGAVSQIPDAALILLDIAATLRDLDGKVVHRDLKPENILFYNGHWCLADFGISRYAEATTAPDTQKYAFSAPYAAPERWLGQRATIATDVYSFGVVAHELLTGAAPFKGPLLHDFREQQLHVDPPPLANVPAILSAVIQEALFKAPEARPSPANLLARLERVTASPATGGLSRLQEAHLAEVSRQAESARQALQAKSEDERRRVLAQSAMTLLQQISKSLKDAIVANAPSAVFRESHYGNWSLDFGRAKLEFSAGVATVKDLWKPWDAPAFEVVAHSALSIRIPPDQIGYEGRSHSLWYCDARDGGRYQWFETAFMFMPLVRKRGPQSPFALSPGVESAKAIWQGMAEYQVAWPFTPLIIGDLDEFIDRWADWFAMASQGKLSYPRSMPERQTENTWRR